MTGEGTVAGEACSCGHSTELPLSQGSGKQEGTRLPAPPGGRLLRGCDSLEACCAQEGTLRGAAGGEEQAPPWELGAPGVDPGLLG